MRNYDINAIAQYIAAHAQNGIIQIHDIRGTVTRWISDEVLDREQFIPVTPGVEGIEKNHQGSDRHHATRLSPDLNSVVHELQVSVTDLVVGLGGSTLNRRDQFYFRPLPSTSFGRVVFIETIPAEKNGGFAITRLAVDQDWIDLNQAA